MGHWDSVWASRSPNDVSWYQERTEVSLRLITGLAQPDTPIVDVGGGASRLVDALVASGFRDLTVVDIASSALEAAKERLGADAAEVRWLTADARQVDLGREVGVWHDRAAFHFMVEPGDRIDYLERVRAHLRPGGHLILATFAEDGPPSCSGLPVHRYNPGTMDETVGGEFEPISHEREAHTTPAGAVQHFLYGVYKRVI